MKQEQIHIDHENIHEVEKYVYPVPKNTSQLYLENYNIHFQGKIKPLFSINETSIILYFSNSLSEQIKISTDLAYINLKNALFYQLRIPNLITSFTLNLSFLDENENMYNLTCTPKEHPCINNYGHS